jgi:hypothetical protein
LKRGRQEAGKNKDTERWREREREREAKYRAREKQETDQVREGEAVGIKAGTLSKPVGYLTID